MKSLLLQKDDFNGELWLIAVDLFSSEATAYSSLPLSILRSAPAAWNHGGQVYTYLYT